MSEADMFLDEVKRYLEAPRDQRFYNKQSCKDRMKYINQEDLINALKKMNLQELRYVMGCGVPGSANTIAVQLVRVRRKEYDKFLKMQSREIISDEKIDLPEEPQSVTISTEDKDSWEEQNEPEPKGSSVEEAIRAFKEGRESDL